AHVGPRHSVARARDDELVIARRHDDLECAIRAALEALRHSRDLDCGVSNRLAGGAVHTPRQLARSGGHRIQRDDADEKKEPMRGFARQASRHAFTPILLKTWRKCLLNLQHTSAVAIGAKYS